MKIKASHITPVYIPIADLIPDKSLFKLISTKVKMKFHLTVWLALLVCCYFARADDGNCEKLKITVTYEALSTFAIEFFRTQLTAALFQELSTCPIEWHILPCATSAMVDDVLTCWKDDPECDMNRIYACATHTYQNDQIKLGTFVTCSIGSNCQRTEWKKCSDKIKMNTNDIEKCSGEKQADKLCNDFHDQIQHGQLTRILSLTFGSQFDADLCDKAIYDFKNVLCDQLKKKGLQCQTCNC